MRLPGLLNVRALVLVLLTVSVVLVILLPFVTPTSQSWLLDRTPATTDVIDLYWVMFWIGAVILLIVEGGIIAAAVLFRQRPGHRAQQYHGNVFLEFTWTIIPAIIVLGLSAYSFRSLSALSDVEGADMVVEVTGRQWVWEFYFPQEDLRVRSEFRIPVNKKVVFEITSVDVIHSFWIPRLSGKLDAVPGRVNRIWVHALEPDVYLGQCAEFCGLNHADMLLKVHVTSEVEFATWVRTTKEEQAKRPPPEKLPEFGKQVTEQLCISCHAFEQNRRSPVAQAPNLWNYGVRGPINAPLKRLKDSGAQDWLERWVKNAPGIKPGIVMPRFEGILTEIQVEGVVAYLKTLGKPAP